jgi:hypothetical protein
MIVNGPIVRHFARHEATSLQQTQAMMGPRQMLESPGDVDRPDRSWPSTIASPRLSQCAAECVDRSLARAPQTPSEVTRKRVGRSEHLLLLVTSRRAQGDGFKVAALRFRIERSKRQRRLAGSRNTGEDYKGIAGNF